ncbi:phosphoesterase [Mytilinidion resinicola]|uniref:Phosphoesterase n=1 Tax=Mytilinidion resinicola TaxID=574789 RepID=A0A6A6Y2W0_9PEZI|nr:phosphoesterase [Mytilinidion resinicola]KAF2803166.1 phosphoesterase [Mytilinidion resinicola]
MEKLRSFFTKSSSASQSFQILSDLHLEVGQQYSSFSIPPSAPYLILGGDIGRLVDYNSYLSFLAQQTAQFEEVFLVLGNHEFYELGYSTGLANARKLESEPVLGGKLILLHQTRYDVPKSSFSILGCTLWSQIPESARPRVQTALNHFRKIEGWTIDSHNAVFDTELAWLKGQVDRQHEQRKILIVTHHAPTIEETAHPQHAGSDLSSAFASSIITDEDTTWEQSDIFRHTHYTNTFKKGGIKIMSNQRGYIYPPGMPGTRLRNKSNEADKEKDKKKVYDASRVVHV